MDEFMNNDMDNEELPFGFRPMPVSDKLREENWKAIEEAMRRQEPVRAVRPGRVIRLVRVFAVAASLAAIAVGIWWIGARTGTVQYSQIRTGYGEIKSIMLPDSSIVTFNVLVCIRSPVYGEEAQRI